MGLEQLIWIVLLLVILLVSVIKRIIGQKRGKRLDRVNLGESIVKKETSARPRPKERDTEWERFLRDMLGIETPVYKTEKEPKEKPVSDSERVADISEKVEIGLEPVSAEKELDKPVRIKSKSHPVPEVEKRHLKPTIEEHYVKVEESGVKMEKEMAVAPFNLFKKVGLKDAIVYSEIIGPPLAKRKHYRIF